MRIQQFSVWRITDNPAQDGFVGLKASFSSEGSGPTEQELARIKELFLLTGLDIANYKACYWGKTRLKSLLRTPNLEFQTRTKRRAAY